MNDDKLKKFINENRSEFDATRPSEDLWSKIDSEVKSKKGGKVVKLSTVIRWSVAAAIIVTVGMIALVVTLSDNSEVVEIAKVEQENSLQPIELSQVSLEMAEVEAWYKSEVNNYVNQLEDLEYDEEMLAEIDFLQSEYEDLKKELGRGADPERIIEAMIDNYRLRLELLKELLQELKDQDHEDNNHAMA